VENEAGREEPQTNPGSTKAKLIGNFYPALNKKGHPLGVTLSFIHCPWIFSGALNLLTIYPKRLHINSTHGDLSSSIPLTWKEAMRIRHGARKASAMIPPICPAKT